MRPKAVLVRSLRYPRDSEKAKGLAVAEATRIWEEAQDKAKLDFSSPELYTKEFDEHQRELMTKLRNIKESEEVGDDYARWCRVVDTYMTMVEQPEDAKVSQYSGRGVSLRFNLVPYLKENCTDDIPLRGGFCGISRTWETLLILLKRFHRTFGKGNQGHEHRLRVNLAQALGPVHCVLPKF